MKSVQLQDQQATDKSPKLLGLAAVPAAVLAFTSLAIVSDLATVDLLGLTRTGEFSSVIRDLTDLPVNFTVIPADTLRATTARVAETLNGMILVPRLVAQLLVGLNLAIIAIYGATSLQRRLAQFRRKRADDSLNVSTDTAAETRASLQPSDSQSAAAPKIAAETELAPVQNSTAAVVAVSEVAGALFEANKRLNTLRQQGQEYASQAAAARGEWNAIGMQMWHIRQLQERSIDTGHTMGKSIGALLQNFKDALSLEVSLAHRIGMVSTYLGEIDNYAGVADQLTNETSGEFATFRTDLGSALALVTALTSRTQEILSVVASMEDVAEQINLVALNSSIQSARAGDQGQGESFAAFATEVSRLSMSSSSSIRSISSLLIAIKNEGEQASARLLSSVQRLSKASDTITRLRHHQSAKLIATNRVNDDVESISNDLGLLVDVLNAARKQSGVISSNSEALNKTQQYCAETCTRLSSEVRHAAASSDRVARLLSSQSYSINHCENLIDGAAVVTREISHFDSKNSGRWNSSRSTVRTASLRTFSGQNTKSQAKVDWQPQLALHIVKGDQSTPTMILADQTPVSSEA